MPRRRGPAPAPPAEGYELCAMCGEPVLVGADGRCELGHRVRPALADTWPAEAAEPGDAAAATVPIAAVGLDEPLPEGEVLSALGGPLDLDVDGPADTDDAAVTQPVDAGYGQVHPGAELVAEDGEPDDAPDADTDGPRRPPADLGGELDW